MRSDKEILEERHKKWGTGTIVRKQDLMIELLMDIRRMTLYQVMHLSGPLPGKHPIYKECKELYEKMK